MLVLAASFIQKRRLFALLKQQLTEEEVAMLSYIGDRRVNKDDIRQVFNLDDRTFYTAVEKIRRKGVWLVASKEKGNSGYYIASTRDELENWISKQYKMIESNTKTYQAMRNGTNGEANFNDNERIS